jgi:hypothetical protein
MKEKTEAGRFDAVVRTLLSASHEELQKRDNEWRRKRAQKSRALSRPSCFQTPVLF